MKHIYILFVLIFGLQLGYGQIGFEEITISSDVPGGWWSVFAADLDGDGDLDILSASEFDDKITWYENLNGVADFGTEQVVTLNVDGVRSVFSVDLDGDGDMDILSASEADDKIAWFENLDGQGSFSSEQIISTDADGAGDIYSIDLDGDGDFDVLSASKFDDKIAWYENIDNQGTFSEPKIITLNANYAFSVYAADIDNDNDMDVLSASWYDGKIAWYENLDGQGDFDSEQIIVASNFGLKSSVIAADLDGDNDIDVISTSLTGSITWYENINFGDSFISRDIIIGSGVEITSVEVADIDNDNDFDIISHTNEVKWYENDGLGNFIENNVSTDFNAGFEVRDLFAVDIDLDGDTDVLTSTGFQTDLVVLFKNLGNLGNEINGIIQNDTDSNGCNNADIGVTNLIVSSDNGNDIFSVITNENGLYQNSVNEGNFVTQIQNLPSYYMSSPTSQTSNFVGIGNTATIDFCIEPTGVYNDLNISVYPSINDPRPGFNTTYRLVYKNVGTIQLSGSVSYEFDDSKLNFLSASETIASQTANTLNFDFTDLNPFETRTIDLEFNVFPPPTTNIDDILISSAIINPVTGDETEEDNVFNLEQTVIGSYDPNDITVLEGEEITIDEADKYLHYLIRFQNTGTASAINVMVEHVLDDKLDWTTMQLESLSHTGRVEIENETDVSFIFNNINLPDSTNDEPNSHGFIAFKIKPKSDVQVGDIITGVADIYFDFNPPITTNTVNTEIVAPLNVHDEELRNVKLFPNPAQNKLQITSNQIIDGLTIIDINGRVLNSIEILVSDYSLDVSSLSKGVYFLEIESGESKLIKKFIKN